jgi:hypothetical protein
MYPPFTNGNRWWPVKDPVGKPIQQAHDEQMLQSSIAACPASRGHPASSGQPPHAGTPAACLGAGLCARMASGSSIATQVPPRIRYGAHRLAPLSAPRVQASSICARRLFL